MAGTIVIESLSVTAKSGGSFVNCNPGGVAISGPIVKINEGGAPGSLGPVAPAKAELPTAPEPATPLDASNVKLEIEFVLPTVKDSVVGERAELKVTVVSGTSRADAKDGEVEWTLQGDPVADYVWGDTLCKVHPVEPAALKKARIEFKWVRPGTFVLMVRGIGKGAAHLPASKTFEVGQPTVIDCRGECTTVDVREDPRPINETWVRYGFKVVLPSQPNHPPHGISFIYSVRAPSRGVDGEITGVQLIQMVARQKRSSDGIWERFVVHKEGKKDKPIETNKYPDESAPYKTENFLRAGSEAAWVNYGEPVADSPGVKARHIDSEVSFDIRARTYFMYRPRTPGSIWVTLRHLDWFAKGSAVRDPAAPLGWRKTSGDGTVTKDAKAVPSHELPVWEANSRIHEWVDE